MNMRARWRTCLVGALVTAALAGCAAGTPATTPALETPPGQGPSGTATATNPSTATPNPDVTPGSIQQTVKPQPQHTEPPVRLNQSQHIGTVQVSLASIKSRNVTGIGPGEISGPALVITVLIKNGSASPVNVQGTTVTLVDSKGKVGVPMVAGVARPFSGSIQAGSSATGVYVFSVGKTARSPIHITVTYNPAHTSVVFVGNAAR